MALSADSLLDRIALKAQVTRWRLLAVIALVLAAVFFFEKNSAYSPIERNFIARVNFDGVVMDDLKRDELMTDIRDDSRIKALIVRLDTPGGSAVAGMEVYKQLREIAKTKPVVAVMRDLSASAGYLIAVGADQIFAREATLTGSIGVIIQSFEASELAGKIGVHPITIKTGPMKDALSPLSKPTPETLELMQNVVDDFYQVFVSTIAERRNLKREDVLPMADGRVFTGRQAVANKLVDAIGSEDDAVMWLVKNKNLEEGLTIKELKPKKDDLPFMDQFADTMMEKISPQSAAGLDGLVAIWHPNLLLQ